MEQRNGRIDRKLQRSKVVRCYYFVFEKRHEDRVPQVLVRKSETIQKQLGSLSPVLERRLANLLSGGIEHRETDALIRSIEKQDGPASDKTTVDEELEGARERKDQLQKQLAQLQDMPQTSKDYLGLDEKHFRDALSASLEILGVNPLPTSSSHRKLRDATLGLSRSRSSPRRRSHVGRHARHASSSPAARSKTLGMAKRSSDSPGSLP